MEQGQRDPGVPDPNDLENLLFHPFGGDEGLKLKLPPEDIELPRYPDILNENTITDIDSGQAFHGLIEKYTARIRQLKAQVASYQRENDQVVDETLLKNLELLMLNQSLEQKVQERTQELEVSKARLERQHKKLLELGETKEALIHMIVHDMKNPLTAILGTLRLFTKNEHHLLPDIHALLVNSHGHGQKLLGMIEQILMISRMQNQEFQLKPELTDLVALTRASLDMMTQTLNGKQVRFRFETENPRYPVWMDAQIIERVITNLLNNAIKYSPEGAEIPVGIATKDNSVLLSVTNWGDLIPKKDQRRIFDLFYRVRNQDAKYGGTGLGLTFCKLAVEAHGGRINVASPVLPEMHGARFKITLPLKPFAPRQD